MFTHRNNVYHWPVQSLIVLSKSATSSVSLCTTVPVLCFDLLDLYLGLFLFMGHDNCLMFPNTIYTIHPSVYLKSLEINEARKNQLIFRSSDQLGRHRLVE